MFLLQPKCISAIQLDEAETEVRGLEALINIPHNNTINLTARLISTQKTLWYLVFCVCLVSLSEGSVDIGGKKRPLLGQSKIQGELELVAENRVDEQGISGNKRKSKTRVFEERLRLKTEGDIYHPNFLFYNAAFGLGLTQQRFSLDDSSEKENAWLNDYSVLAQLLRAKPYPVTFNLSKSEDLIARRFLGSLKAETENLGVTLALRSDEWPMTFQYSTSETSQDGLASLARDFFERDDERFKYSLAHDFSDFSHLSFGFDRNKISQRTLGASTDLTENRYTVLHDLSFGSDQKHRLDSFFSFLDQSDSFSLESLQWEERLRLQHSSNLMTNYELRFVDTEQASTSNKETRGRAGFEHKLFESLVTTGNVFTSRSDLGTQGKLTQQGGTLGLNYRKTNPWGVLFSTYTTSFTGADQSGGRGTGIVTDESHVFTDPLPITLDRVNIDTSTIVVTDNTGLNVYTLGDDYTLTEINGRIRLTMTTLGSIPPNVSDGQEVLVDYNFFVEPKRQEDTLRQNFTIRERFDNDLSLYYAHQRQDEKITSSIVEITPDEFRINTFGADYIKKNLSLLAEYSKESSTQIPSTSKRLEARYSLPLWNDTTASIRVSNQWLDLHEPDDRDIDLFRIGGEILSRLAEPYAVSARIDYRNEDDSRFGATKGLQLNSELQYNYRQLSMILGFELNMLERRRDEINSEFLYFRLKRLF